MSMVTHLFLLQEYKYNVRDESASGRMTRRNKRGRVVGRTILKQFCQRGRWQIQFKGKS